MKVEDQTRIISSKRAYIPYWASCFLLIVFFFSFSGFVEGGRSEKQNQCLWVQTNASMVALNWTTKTFGWQNVSIILYANMLQTKTTN